MKNSGIFYVAGGVALLLLVSSKAKANDVFNLQDLASRYDQENIDRLITVENALYNYGLTDLQIKFLLAQVLQETGLFTDHPNYHATDVLNNYAGLSLGGSLNSYSNVADFVDDWLSPVYLDKGHYPLQATTIDDFNTRLKQNNYYTDSAVTYGNNLRYYFNLL